MWLPHVDPATVIVGPAPDGFGEARTVGDVTVARSRLTENGRPGPLGRPADTLPMALMGDAGAARPAALVIPFDENAVMRLEAADWLLRTMAGDPPARPPNALTLPQRRRLALMLRGLDGRLAGYSYRQIAIALFAPRFIPAGRGRPTTCAAAPFACATGAMT